MMTKGQNFPTSGSFKCSTNRCSNIARGIVLIVSVASRNKPRVIGQHGILFGLGEHGGDLFQKVVLDRAEPI
jgi:hypothetical protein